MPICPNCHNLISNTHSLRYFIEISLDTIGINDNIKLSNKLKLDNLLDNYFFTQNHEFDLLLCNRCNAGFRHFSPLMCPIIFGSSNILPIVLGKEITNEKLVSIDNELIDFKNCVETKNKNNAKYYLSAVIYSYEINKDEINSDNIEGKNNNSNSINDNSINNNKINSNKINDNSINDNKINSNKEIHYFTIGRTSPFAEWYKYHGENAITVMDDNKVNTILSSCEIDKSQLQRSKDIVMFIPIKLQLQQSNKNNKNNIKIEQKIKLKPHILFYTKLTNEQVNRLKEQDRKIHVIHGN